MSLSRPTCRWPTCPRCAASRSSCRPSTSRALPCRSPRCGCPMARVVLRQPGRVAAPRRRPRPGRGRGRGTGDEGGYIVHAAPRTAILPPLAQVPGSVAGRTLRVSFWVAADGRVTRVAVDPPIADAAYNREFQRRMMAYQFYPAHTRGGRTLEDVVIVPLRIGN